ncbi:hypothetical protein D917_02311 [Trichinella nativa]|uniref:Uncharacterized protein n=1 Tax=Trichinella nativa TaxID=6335 RepID=A0A1Y3EGC4_9BILA|nr:hypothetical protein D917_02311 [Trichinella nativa]
MRSAVDTVGQGKKRCGEEEVFKDDPRTNPATFYYVRVKSLHSVLDFDADKACQQPQHTTTDNNYMKIPATLNVEEKLIPRLDRISLPAAIRCFLDKRKARTTHEGRLMSKLNCTWRKKKFLPMLSSVEH